MSDGVVSRRVLLHSGAVAVAGTLPGCIDDGESRTNDVDPPPFGPLASEWPLVGFDAQGTAASPAAEGPLTEPTVEWQIRLAGRAAPRVVATDAVLAVAGGEGLHVFDLAAGERAWSLDRAPASVPALDSQHLYVLADGPRLTAYPHDDDEETWDRTLGGAHTAPVVHDGTVYVGHDDGRISAVDATDGEVLWQITVGDRVHDLVTDGEYVAAHTDTGLVVRPLEDRSSGWEIDVDCCREQSPAIRDGAVYSGGNDMTSFDLDDGDQYWSRKVTYGTSHAPTVDADRVYLGRRTLTAFDATTGETDWEADLQVEEVGPRPVVTSDTAFVGGGPTERRVEAVATDDGASRWSAWIDGPPLTLVVVGRRLLVGSSGGRLFSVA